MKSNLLLSILFLFFLFSCRDTNKGTEVTVTIKGAAGKKIFLYKEPFIDELAVKIDSAIVVDLNHPVKFTVDGEQRLYMLHVENSINSYYFINDVPEITINANDINGKYSVDLSPASVSLKDFNDSQTTLAKQLRKWKHEMDSLQKRNLNTDSVNKIFSESFAAYTNNYVLYADTVPYPAALMSAYLNIDFGKDYKSLKQFVDKAVGRFPEYKPILELKKETDDMVSIFEHEYNVGDTIPVISLKNDRNTAFSTKQLQGKYYLIDFWATWCAQCMEYNYYKKQLWQQFKDSSFAMVSVALDDDKNNWLNYLSREKLEWTQLIDEKMWRGTAANTLKFDSIPFNFLVNPKGIIVDKAIKADSLSVAVLKYLK